MWSQQTLEREVARIQKDIEIALDLTYPKREQTVRIGNVKWHNPDIVIATRKVKQALSKHKRLNSAQSYEELRLARREHSYIVRKAKRTSWQDFCNSTVSVNQMARLSKIIQKKDNHTLELVEPRDNPERVVQALVNEHFPDNIPVIEHNYKTGERSLKSLPFIDCEKVIQAIKTFQGSWAR
jgi:hypothetical protein